VWFWAAMVVGLIWVGILHYRYTPRMFRRLRQERKLVPVIVLTPAAMVVYGAAALCGYPEWGVVLSYPFLAACLVIAGPTSFKIQCEVLHNWSPSETVCNVRHDADRGLITRLSYCCSWACC